MNYCASDEVHMPVQKKWMPHKIQAPEWTGWRDRTNWKAVYPRIGLGTTRQFVTEIEARAAVAGIVLEINVNDPRLQTCALTISQLTEHYRRREISADNTWKS